MKRNIWLLTMLFSMLLGISAFAAEITTVRLDMAPEIEDSMTAGQLAAGEEPGVYDSTYFIYNYSVSGSHDEPKKLYYYYITVHPSDNNTFSKTCAVEARGASKIEMTSRSDSSISVKVTTYPFYVLKNPTGIEQDGDEYKWNKVAYADKYSVHIYWTDEDGDEHDTTTSVSSSSRKVNVSSYDSGDRTIKEIYVQARASSLSNGGKFIADSQYVNADGAVDDELSDDSYTFSIPTARTNAIATSTTTTTVKNANATSKTKLNGPGLYITSDSSTAAGKSGKATVPATASTWMRYKNDWYYYSNGLFLKGWICPDKTNWYLLDNSGKMLTGLQRVDGRWYLLNPYEGSTQGAVLTGWWKLNNNWYYFNKEHDGTYGAMLINTVTPDGQHVGSDGVWLGY